MENYFENSQILTLLFRRKKLFILVFLISVILSVFFSSPYFIKPKFKSSATLYPANITSFTDESLNEQMIQVLNSKDIKDSIIKEFNLISIYKIDTTGGKFYNNLIKEYEDQINIGKTKYEAVNIEVEDTDPKRASNMVWSIIKQYDQKVDRMQKMKYYEDLVLAQNHLNRKQQYVDSLRTRYNNLTRNFELFDFDKQITEITKGFLGTVDGNGSNINKTDVVRLKNLMKEKAVELIEISNIFRNEVYALDNFKIQVYDQAQYNYNRKNTHYHLVSEPFPADKKTSPTRWLIVLIVTAANLVFAFILAALFENREIINSIIGKTIERKA